jgi:hypothetical protein
MGAGPGGYDEKSGNVNSHTSTNGISYIPAQNYIISVCSHLIHGVYVRPKVRAEQHRHSYSYRM